MDHLSFSMLGSLVYQDLDSSSNLLLLSLSNSSSVFFFFFTFMGAILDPTSLG